MSHPYEAVCKINKWARCRISEYSSNWYVYLPRKLSASGSVCNVSVWYFHSRRRGAALPDSQVSRDSVPPSRSFSFVSTDATRVVWQYGVRLMRCALSERIMVAKSIKTFMGPTERRLIKKRLD